MDLSEGGLLAWAWCKDSCLTSLKALGTGGIVKVLAGKAEFHWGVRRRRVLYLRHVHRGCWIIAEGTLCSFVCAGLRGW